MCRARFSFFPVPQGLRVGHTGKFSLLSIIGFGVLLAVTIVYMSDLSFDHPLKVCGERAYGEWTRLL